MNSIETYNYHPLNFGSNDIDEGGTNTEVEDGDNDGDEQQEEDT